MDKTQIKQLASELTTRKELLVLLNKIRREEVKRKGIAEKYYLFTMKHLNYYCNPNNTFHRYNYFEIEKKSGGTRKITTPRNRSYMELLRCVNTMFKSIYTPSDYAKGFTEGRSVVTNANAHIGQNYVFNIDLKDFFQSIEQPRIWKRFQLEPFCFPATIANVLAGLCSMRETLVDDTGKKTYKYVLPQGAPTSPIITNMICDKLDRRLAGLAKRFGIHYSRYADDITFSSMHYVYAKDGDFRTELERIISDQGFTINISKTRLQKRGSRQEVTGIIVSNKINVTKKYTREIRSLLYIWEKYGYSKALLKYMQKHSVKNDTNKKKNANLMTFLNGKLLYLKMVKGGKDPVYSRLHEKYIELMPKNNKKYPYLFTYLETKPLLEFEKENNTNVIFYCKENVRYATFLFGNIQQKAIISKDISMDKELDKEELNISYCTNCRKKQIWYIS